MHQIENRTRTYLPCQAGMHLAIYVDGCDDTSIEAAAGEEGILLLPLSASYVGQAKRSGFVLGFGNSKTGQIPQAVTRLRKLLDRGLKPRSCDRHTPAY
jgi:GntR family transcriptional regulator / MocR family aminotransferase